jgi:hypothetical protein
MEIDLSTIAQPFQRPRHFHTPNHRGYCYLRLIKKRYRAKACELLGEFPKLLTLRRLPDFCLRPNAHRDIRLTQWDLSFPGHISFLPPYLTWEGKSARAILKTTRGNMRVGAAPAAVPNLPGRLSSNVPTVGLSSWEATSLKHANEADAKKALSARSIANARANRTRHTLIDLPVDCSPAKFEAFTNAFPASDFIRTRVQKPHMEAAAARRACIDHILTELSAYPPASITLVGPSFSQFSRFQLAFPATVIYVYQPIELARDQARWRLNTQYITHPFEWNSSTAVKSDIVIALFSIGNMFMSDFCAGAAVAESRRAFVLHHFAPEVFVSKHTDPVLDMTFELSGDDIACSYADSAPYLDSASAHVSWITNDARIPGHSFMCDVVCQLSSLFLLDYQIGRGISCAAATPLINFSQDYRVLPPDSLNPRRIIATKTYDKLAEYMSRQTGTNMCTEVARNRLAALSHRVVVGSTTIQEQIFLDDLTAAHLANTVVKEMQLVRSHAELNEDRTAIVLERNADHSFAGRLFNAVDARAGLPIGVFETAARTTVNFWCAAPAKLLTGSFKTVDFTPAFGWHPSSTLNNGLHDLILSPVEKDLASIRRPFTDFVPEKISSHLLLRYRSATFAQKRILTPASNFIIQALLFAVELQDQNSRQATINFCEQLLGYNPLQPRPVIPKSFYEEILWNIRNGASVNPNWRDNFVARLRALLAYAANSLRQLIAWLLTRLGYPAVGNLLFGPGFGPPPPPPPPPANYPGPISPPASPPPPGPPPAPSPPPSPPAPPYHRLSPPPPPRTPTPPPAADIGVWSPLNIVRPLPLAPLPLAPPIDTRSSSPINFNWGDEPVEALPNDENGIVRCRHCQSIAYVDASGPHYGITLPFACHHSVASVGNHLTHPHTEVLRRGLRWFPTRYGANDQCPDCPQHPNADPAPQPPTYVQPTRSLYEINPVLLNPDLSLNASESENDHLLFGRFNLFNRVCDPVSNTNPIDSLCTIMPLADDILIDHIDFFHRPHSARREVTAGPETLLRCIMFGLSHLCDFDRRDRATLSRAIQDNAHDIHSSGISARMSEIIQDNRFTERLQTFLSEPAATKPLDILVTGLPASAKSTIMCGILGENDVVVVPTNELRQQWQIKIRESGSQATVVTQHVPIFDERQYRLMVIDEVYLYEINHLTALIRRAQFSIGVGDPAQIIGFNMRDSGRQFITQPAFARLAISAPFSFGLPLPVLLLGKRLGFVPPHSRTLNATGRLELFNRDAPVNDNTATHRHIVFNRSRTSAARLTAHEAQGTRCESADVVADVQEEFWVPFSGHFWVAITRATQLTRLVLCAGAAENLRNAVHDVRGFPDAYRSLNVLESFVAAVPEYDESLQACAHKGSIIEFSDAATAAISRAQFQAAFQDYRDDPRPAHAVIDLSEHQISAALAEVNANYSELAYADVVDLADPSFSDDFTTFCSIRPDFSSTQSLSTSTLAPAGVLFSSQDSKTEFYTIVNRYLLNPRFQAVKPVSLAHDLVDSFHLAYVDPSKVFIPVDKADGFHSWLADRNAGLFHPSDDPFGTSRTSVTFSSFLKAHAKAKNDAGFGTKLEKGQTIAAGDQSYNARFTSLNRELCAALQQVLYDDVILDIGFSDYDFECRAKQIGLYSATNTQIDLSSQDSTHREHHVLSFLSLLHRYTSATEEECKLYYEMRKSFVVKAKNFATDSAITYRNEWTLPSGDPFTLIVNCIMEATSTSFAFALTPTIRGPCVIKGDDQYYAKRLLFGTTTKSKLALLGIKVKLDYDLPPFVVGRMILPDNTCHFDPIKYAAKYSVKRFAPELYPEYCLAYRQMFKPLLPHERHYLEFALAYHHPTMSISSIMTLIDFTHSLHDISFFSRFQRVDVMQQLQLINPPSNCIHAVLRYLGHPPMQIRQPNARQVEAHCIDYRIPYYRSTSHAVARLVRYAQSHPNLVVFNYSHAVTYGIHHRHLLV